MEVTVVSRWLWEQQVFNKVVSIPFFNKVRLVVWEAQNICRHYLFVQDMESICVLEKVDIAEEVHKQQV